MYGEENIISAVIHVDAATTPHLCIVIFVLLTKGESIGEDVIGDKKKNAQDARGSLLFEAMQEGCLALNSSARLESRRKHNSNGLDQKLRKDDRAHQGT